jgi:hypothetical protein
MLTDSAGRITDELAEDLLAKRKTAPASASAPLVGLAASGAA